MKKLEVGELENLDKSESEVFEFLKKIDLENISKMEIRPLICEVGYYTIFYFYIKGGQKIRFKYRDNQKIINIRVWEPGKYVSEISLKEYDEKKENWMNAIWEKFVDHFNLRIRLMFINETKEWDWETEFTY